VTTAVDQWTSQHLAMAHGVANMAVVQRFLAGGDAASLEDFAAVKDIADGLVGKSHRRHPTHDLHLGKPGYELSRGRDATEADTLDLRVRPAQHLAT
jgi:hypothetical protein